MAEPFEDPRKAELRARCEVAIDAAGYELVGTLVSFPFIGTLKGAIKGDLQSIDGESIRYVYYLRPAGKKALPQWLISAAESARRYPEIRLFVVSEEVGELLERSCASQGMGLLKVTEDNTFEMLVNPVEFEEEQTAKEFAERVTAARRQMERKLRLKTKALTDDYGTVATLTEGMPARTRDQYIEDVEGAVALWEEWGRQISELLDAAAAFKNSPQLLAAQELIEAGISDPDS
jgi:hypothetical protein